MKDNLDIFRIRTNNIAPKKGRVLIAEPFLPGDYFSRSVILLVAYSVKGAVGFIINKKVDLSLQDLLPEFADFEGDVYSGGPVSTDSVYFLHKMGGKIPGSIHVLGNLYWGGDFEVLKQMIKTGLISTSEVRFFVGYSGWESGQLEREIKEDSWLVNDVDEETVMHKMNEATWTDFVRKAGGQYSMWENFPENPAMN